MLEKTGDVKIGITKCGACNKPSTLTLNGQPCCDECAAKVAEASHEKKASQDNDAVKQFFPERETA